jgi:hypothetical protein
MKCVLIVCRTNYFEAGTGYDVVPFLTSRASQEETDRWCRELEAKDPNKHTRCEVGEVIDLGSDSEFGSHPHFKNLALHFMAKERLLGELLNAMLARVSGRVAGFESTLQSRPITNCVCP